MSGTHVNVDNFDRAETDRMFAAIERDAGGLNRWHHNRMPTPLDHQTVIRMNRDTLYSMAVVDISGGATITVPDAGHRYVSVMVVNQDHYVNKIFHEPGEHELTVAEFDTPYVVVAARVSQPAMVVEPTAQRVCAEAISPPGARRLPRHGVTPVHVSWRPRHCLDLAVSVEMAAWPNAPATRNEQRRAPNAPAGFQVLPPGLASRLGWDRPATGP
jgi:hypothetical protein